MSSRENSVNELSRLSKQNGSLLAVFSEPATVSEEVVKERISQARDLLLKKLGDAGESSLATALEETSVEVFRRPGTSLMEGELRSTRHFRPYDSTGDALLSTIYLCHWTRFDDAATVELAGEIERLLRQAVTEHRIPHQAARLRNVSEDVLPVACGNCGRRLHVLRHFSESAVRYDCGMCKRCNEVLCPACFPAHLHRYQVREKCRKCGGSGVFSQLVAKHQSFLQKLLAERPDYDLVTQPCSACDGQGLIEI